MAVQQQKQMFIIIIIIIYDYPLSQTLLTIDELPRQNSFKQPITDNSENGT